MYHDKPYKSQENATINKDVNENLPNISTGKQDRVLSAGAKVPRRGRRRFVSTLFDCIQDVLTFLLLPQVLISWLRTD